ncbi:MAG: hypothetical protein ACRD9R_16255 [Pyrinomonadaceae bacterium]
MATLSRQRSAALVGTLLLAMLAQTSPASVPGNAHTISFLAEPSRAFSTFGATQQQQGPMEVSAPMTLDKGTTTIPKNVSVVLRGEGRLSVPAASTLVIAGSLSAPRRQIFDGPGAVMFAAGAPVSHVYPEWWGASGDGATDNAPAFEKMLSSLSAPGVGFTPGARIECARGNYYFSRQLVLTRPIILSGVGMDFAYGVGTSFTFAAGSGGIRVASFGLIAGYSTGADGRVFTPDDTWQGSADGSTVENLALHSSGTPSTATVNTTAGSADITATTAAFTRSDVGRVLTIPVAGPALAADATKYSDLNSVIVEFVSPTRVRTLFPAARTLAGTGAKWGGAGITLHTRARIQNVHVESFTSDGVHWEADTNGNPYYSNASHAALSKIRVQNCYGHGVFIRGGDTNISTTEGLDLSNNQGWAVWDNSFLGNVHTGAHAAENGLFKVSTTKGSPLVTSTYPGNGAFTRADVGQTIRIDGGAGTHLIASYVSPTQVTLATPVAATATNVYGRINGRGGAFRTDITGHFSATLFNGCYSEGGQDASVITSPAIAIGGQHGSGFDAASTGLVIVPNNREDLLRRSGGAMTGQVNFPVRTASATDGLNPATDYHVLLNCTFNYFFSLPSADATTKGRVYVLKRLTAVNGASVIIDPAGTDTIELADGTYAALRNLTRGGETLVLTSDGAGKWLVFSNGSSGGTAAGQVSHGACALSSGVCDVSAATVTAVSRIFLTAQDNKSVGALRVSARRPGVGFTVTSSSPSDAGLVAWQLVEP